MKQDPPPPMRFDLNARGYPTPGMREKWAMEIGHLMVAFGSIEALTYMALKELPRDPIQEPLKKLLLRDRIDLLLAILESHKGGAFEQFRKLLREVRSLAEKRNLVAHNGVGLDVFVNVDDGSLRITESIRSSKKQDEAMDFRRIVEHRKRAEELEFELHEVWVFVSRLVQLARDEEQRALRAFDRARNQ